MTHVSVQALAGSRERTGRFNTPRNPVPPALKVRQGDLRLKNPVHVLLFLSLIYNASGAPTHRRPEHTTTVPPSGPKGCPPADPNTLAVAVRETGKLLAQPVHTIYNGVEGALHPCPPTQSPLVATLLDGAEVGVNLLEMGLAGPAVPAAIHAAGDALEVLGDGLEGKPLNEAIIDDVLGNLPGFSKGSHPAFEPQHPLPELTQGPTSLPMFASTARVIQQGEALDPARMLRHAPEANGIIRYRDAVTDEPRRAIQVGGKYYCVQHADESTLIVAGVALKREGAHYVVSDEPVPSEGQQLRCRRAPGEGCSRLPATTAPVLSTALSDVLRSHIGQGITGIQAQERQIVPDPDRPGWHMRMKEGRHHAYLKFGGRYFPVKKHQYGGCVRVTVHLPRSHRGESRGPALVDIVETSNGERSELITQTERNARRGLSKGASCVYEHAVKHPLIKELNQFQQAALLNYHGPNEVALDNFMRDGTDLAYRQREFEGQIHSLKKALDKIPPYTGRVYRAALLPTHVLERLVVGSTVYVHTFMRANGDRQAALAEIAGREVPRGQEPMLLNVLGESHPIGMATLRDEGEVLFDSGRVYRVSEIRAGELVLQDVSALRQTLGPVGATTLRLG